jgi:hypothetical protein
LLLGDNPILAIGFWADFRRLILHPATTPPLACVSELVAALNGFCAYFLGGLAFPFLLFGLPVDFGILMSSGGCLLFGMLGISTRIVRSPWRKPLLTLLPLVAWSVRVATGFFEGGPLFFLKAGRFFF